LEAAVAERYVPADEVTFTLAEWDKHNRDHMGDALSAAPRFGCPCCFLTLVYAQVDPPMVDLAEQLLRRTLSAPGPSGARARELMKAFVTIPERIRARHLRGGDA
jgi:hypothetical protein